MDQPAAGISKKKIWLVIAIIVVVAVAGVIIYYQVKKKTDKLTPDKKKQPTIINPSISHQVETPASHSASNANTQ